MFWRAQAGGDRERERESIFHQIIIMIILHAKRIFVKHTAHKINGIIPSYGIFHFFIMVFFSLLLWIMDWISGWFVAGWLVGWFVCFCLFYFVIFLFVTLYLFWAHAKIIIWNVENWSKSHTYSMAKNINHIENYNFQSSFIIYHIFTCKIDDARQKRRRQW